MTELRIVKEPAKKGTAAKEKVKEAIGKAKMTRAPFPDERIPELHGKIYNFAKDTAWELKIPMATLVGILDNVKHEIQHEFTPISEDMIDY